MDRRRIWNLRSLGRDPEDAIQLVFGGKIVIFEIHRVGGFGAGGLFGVFGEEVHLRGQAFVGIALGARSKAIEHRRRAGVVLR